MTHLIPLSLSLFAAAFSDPIACLNACLQKRFVGATTFGMSRVLPNRYHGVDRFQPENPVEQEAVAELTAKGYQVVIFLAGRHVLDKFPSPLVPPRYGIQGPAYVANARSGDLLPDREALLAESRKAMLTPASYEVKINDWVVAMRPLRATNETCIRCHAPTKLGDALGIAIYAYRNIVR